MNAARSRFFVLRQKARVGIWVEALGAAAVALGSYAIVSFVLDRNLRLEWPFRLALLLGFAYFVARIVRDRLLRPLGVGLDDNEMALAVERRAPEVRQALISSVQFERALAGDVAVVDSRALMGAAIADLEQRLAAIPFANALNGARVGRFAGVLAAGVLGFGTWGAVDGANLWLWARRNLALSSVEWPRYTSFEFANADHIRMPQGDPLTIAVNVAGPVPDQVFVYFEFEKGESGVEPMSATGEREFAWTLPAVIEGLVLHVEGGDGLSKDVSVEVVERPRIEDLAIRVFYPEYMEKEPTDVGASEGEIKLPRGGRLEIAARSHKPIEDAFLLFGNELKVPLVRDDAHAFHGAFAPETSGLLEVNVTDTDKLNSGTPPKLLLRMADDRPPSVDLRLRGIGSLISFKARLPGDLKVKDDFGLRSVGAGWRLQEDTTTSPKPPGTPTEEPAEIPFEPVAIIYGSDLRPGSVRFESTVSADLLQINPDAEDQNSAKNRARPGMLLSLRYGAKDNFGPGDPHESFSETITFRIVTTDKLTEELRRRQIEQRHELKDILDEVRTSQTEVKEMPSPSGDDPKAPLAKARLRALSRQVTALGRRVAFVGETYQRILWEFENNRLIEPPKVRTLEDVITKPLEAVAKDDFPATSRLVETYAGNGQEGVKVDSLASYDKMIRAIEAVLKVMEQAETLAALLEELRTVIKVEDSAIRDVEKRLEETLRSITQPRDKEPEPPKNRK